ncbi:fatty acid desaturase [Tsukamurella tyrosinosolvens]|uniref:fatty acid desaturase family protein n=1 Tax=Tsukamurella tyrosinosolvens TaxID=57704 RepID=UPI00079B86BF|nr:fatty acid desaturase [Tsukamurella tyrosinosolvens]KXP06990.1 fatty acid desaturase [Tsukamurella tyrosinosolvens]KZL98191.1 fatty acid desaturase [Tsukamurella tyrosinosolvens]MCA4994340.1 fatty acid desaturase [Tsukamurella tyrosinosolvens]WEL92382.1 fatty acid desaturase [Tsukamurella tyrosinosolvens]
MAITDIPEYAHLTEADVETLGAELDAIRRDIEAVRGESDVQYLQRTIAAQRGLEVAGRLMLLGAHKRGFWWGSAATLGLAKIIENMELGHNIMHGQWDWMNDPEVHSTTWEWDNAGTSRLWKHTHNYVHHKYTNVLDMDDDVGYKTLRVTRDQPWTPFNSGNLVYNTILMLLFEYGVAIQHLELGRAATKWKKSWFDREGFKADASDVGRKIGRQVLKDYVAAPLVGVPFSGKRGWRKALTAMITANVIRNIWTNAVIFCGHFPDGAEKFTKQDVDNETQAEWYLRQMLGSANLSGGPVIDFLSGNLSYQIEHHLFPDLPSNRLAEIGVRVRALCEKYDLPYTIGPLHVQYYKSWRTIAKLSLPDKYLRDTADDAPETASEAMFAGTEYAEPRIDERSGRRFGLKAARAAVHARRGSRRP